MEVKYKDGRYLIDLSFSQLSDLLMTLERDVWSDSNGDCHDNRKRLIEDIKKALYNIPNKDEIVYGDKEILSEEEFHPENVKQKISFFITVALLDKLKQKSKGKALQTFIIENLKKIVEKP